jgi:hypothetical protein
MMLFFLDSASFGHEDVAFRRLKILEIDKFWENFTKNPWRPIIGYIDSLG